MRFEGEQLRDILMRQSAPVQVLDRFGRVEIEYRRACAAVGLLRLGEYTGTGTKQRIRFIRAESAEDQVTPWGADIDFTPPKRRMRGGRPKEPYSAWCQIVEAAA
jgi:hypothetical protein